MPSVDLIVVGGGIRGCATAWAASAVCARGLLPAKTAGQPRRERRSLTALRQASSSP